MKIYRKTFAEINLTHLQSNIRKLRSLLGADTFFCPMVKANAYGHGDVEVVQKLKQIGVSAVGVVLVEEGLRLREAGLNDIDILVFGPFGPEACEVLVQSHLTPVLSRWDQFESLEKHIRTSLSIHLKFDTGMFRMGFSANEAVSIKDFLSTHSKFQLEGFCTHLSDGEDASIEGGRTDLQIKKIMELSSHFNSTPQHVLNSAGLIGFYVRGKMKQIPFLGARPGIAMYGAKPNLADLCESEKERYDRLELKEVMCLKSSLVHWHKVKKGERVSYGGQWKAKKDSIVGVIGIGYADGYPRSLSNLGEMILHGQRVPVVGTVCMDYTLVDMTELFGKFDIQLNEEVIVFGGGEDVSIQSVAEKLNTIPYEIMTSVSSRVPRVYVV